MPLFRKPPKDWEVFGNATRVPDENTLPVVGDKWHFYAGEKFVELTINSVQDGQIETTLPNGININVSWTKLEICYDRMGGYSWVVRG